MVKNEMEIILDYFLQDIREYQQPAEMKDFQDDLQTSDT
jgi:hypothetical protein